jgi:hypothetical protein
VRATFDMTGLDARARSSRRARPDDRRRKQRRHHASDIELLIFRTPDAPAAVGDNVTNPIAAATRAKAVARFRFDDTGWTGPLGTVAAGTSQVQG